MNLHVNESKKPRFYLDTSVIGGCFDSEFSSYSNRLVELIKKRKVIPVISDLVLRELSHAPVKVRKIFAELEWSDVFEIYQLTKEILSLGDCYLAHDVVTKKSKDDAIHVACATIARVDAIVSWNFKDIVRFDRIRGFNSVNVLQGYGILSILSPQGVLGTEESSENENKKEKL